MLISTIIITNPALLLGGARGGERGRMRHIWLKFCSTEISAHEANRRTLKGALDSGGGCQILERKAN